MRRLLTIGVVLGLLLFACSSGELFVFGEDDLCEWINEEEVTQLARDAHQAVGMDWDGTAELVVQDTGDYECKWSLGSEGEVAVYNWPDAQLFDDDPVSYEDLETDWIDIGPTVTGHPDFDEDILISNNAYGRYAFWVSGTDDALFLSVYLDPSDDESDAEYDWETPLFIVAKGFLEEMNWMS